MRESRTYGFVRGVLGDQHPYRDSQTIRFGISLPRRSGDEVIRDMAGRGYRTQGRTPCQAFSDGLNLRPHREAA